MRIVLSIFCLGAVLAGCRSDVREDRWLAMDTEFSVTLHGRGKISPEKAFAVLHAEASRLEQRFSDYLPGSDLNRLRGEAGDTLRPDAEQALLFGLAESLSLGSHGRFDVTLGRLKHAYGLGSGEVNRVPSEAEIAHILQDNPVFQGDTVLVKPPFHLLPDGRLAILRDSLEFDFGAIAKGYTIGRLSTLLDSMGFRAHLVSAGGDMFCGGEKPKGSWRVGIRHPRLADSVCGVLKFDSSMAISTSGDYERCFFVNGVRYHHILDPSTGKPARPYCAVTVIGRGSLIADGLSTTLFVVGPERAGALLKTYSAEALWIRENPDASLCAIVSPGFTKHLKSLSIPPCKRS